MKIVNLKLLELINSFSKVDIKELKKLVRSPLYSGGRNYVSLLKALLKFKGKDYDKISPQKLYSAMYKGKKFNAQTLKNRLSELLKLCEEYMLYKILKSNSEDRQLLLLKSYHQFGIPKMYERRFHSAEKQFIQLQENDIKFFRMLLFYRQHIDFLTRRKISGDTFDKYFEFSTFTSYIFLIVLFEFGIEYQQQEQTERSYEFNIAKEILGRLHIDDIINNIRSKDTVITKLVCMHYYFYKAFKNQDEENNYFEARKIFNEVSSSLDKNYKIQQYNIMTYYCIIRNNYGIKKFQFELFKLYNEKLKLGIYHDSTGSFFPSSVFRNYVLLGILLKKYNWTENFIKKYSHEIKEDEREDEIKLSYSRLYFSQKEYDKTLSILKNFRGLNYLQYCDSSVLKLCTFYETKDYEDAFSEIDKFRHYLRSHKEIPRIHKVYTRNFLKLYLMLIKLITGVEKKDLSGIEELFRKTLLVSRRNWISEKINELRNK